jgi:hypothetical protein
MARSRVHRSRRPLSWWSRTAHGLLPAAVLVVAAGGLIGPVAGASAATAATAGSSCVSLTTSASVSASVSVSTTASAQAICGTTPIHTNLGVRWQ